MPRTIGVVVAERLAVGWVDNLQLAGSPAFFPSDPHDPDRLLLLPGEQIVSCLHEQIKAVAQGEQIERIGIALPGIIQNGIVEELPNLPQLKGMHLQSALQAAFQEQGQTVLVRVFNDADAMAAGIAASLGHLDQLIRVWMLGHGVGYGQHPCTTGIWEGGHMVVTLDPKENLCGCGGSGHLEGILGMRSMRLRFLDMEPEEVFAEAEAGDARCSSFVKLWHRALAAATASSIHMNGSGKWFITGPNANHINLVLLQIYLAEMVKMSPLQGSSFQIIPTTDEIGIVGAAVNVESA